MRELVYSMASALALGLVTGFGFVAFRVVRALARFLWGRR